MAIETINNSLSQRVNALQPSKIREVAEAGMTMDGVIPLWFGEGAWPTSNAIVAAAVDSLQAGNHKYQPNNGAPSLRQAVCAYSAKQLDCQLSSDQVTVTPSGMQGLMLSAELLISHGDRVVIIEPVWPNISECFKAMGANIHPVPLHEQAAHWVLDLNELIAALTPNTQVLVVNSPNNPTGWTLNAEDQVALLSHCRQYGIWIVADDVYSRLYRHASHAPSFLSICDKHDRVISVNSFSKSWSMTGWRLGWMVTPPECEAKLGQLTEFNTSCTPGFVQEAGVVALEHGEDNIRQLNARIQAGYELTSRELKALPKVNFIESDGAFYAFFKVHGLTDSHQAAMDILVNTKVGLAPGVAFGNAGEGYLRLCYAQPVEVLQEAFERLKPYLS